MSLFKKKSTYPEVHAKLWITQKSDDIGLSFLSDELGIEGMITKKSDYRNSVIDAGYAFSCWGIDVLSSNVVSIEDEIIKLIHPLFIQKDKVNRLCKQYDLDLSITTAIHFKREDYPLMCLEKNVIEMMNAINVTEFSIDLYRE